MVSESASSDDLSAKQQKVANNVSVVLPACNSKSRRAPKKLGNKVGVVYQRLLQSNVKSAKNVGVILPASSSKPRKLPKKSVSTAPLDDRTTLPPLPTDMGDCITLPLLPPDTANSMLETDIICPSMLKLPPLLTDSSSKPSAKGRGRKKCAKGVVLGSGKSDEFIGKLVAFFLDSPYGKALKSSFR
jgi:hypothetical protein